MKFKKHTIPSIPAHINWADIKHRQPNGTCLLLSEEQINAVKKALHHADDGRFERAIFAQHHLQLDYDILKMNGRYYALYTDRRRRSSSKSPLEEHLNDLQDIESGEWLRANILSLPDDSLFLNIVKPEIRRGLFTHPLFSRKPEIRVDVQQFLRAFPSERERMITSFRRYDKAVLIDSSEHGILDAITCKWLLENAGICVSDQALKPEQKTLIHTSSIRPTQKGEEKLCAVVKEFFEVQSKFHQDMQHMITVLNEIAFHLSEKDKNKLMKFLEPYKLLTHYPDFFSATPTNVWEAIQKITDILHKDNLAFSTLITGFQTCIARKQKMFSLLANLEERYPDLYHTTSNKLTKSVDLKAKYDPVAIFSTVIKPVQHLARYTLLLDRILEEAAPFKNNLRSALTLSKDYLVEVCSAVNSLQRRDTVTTLFKTKTVPADMLKRDKSKKLEEKKLKKAHSY